jgi:hypothetical protein
MRIPNRIRLSGKHGGRILEKHSGGASMKSGVTSKLVLAAYIFTPFAFAQTQPSPAVELKAAIAAEQVKGDLDGAIEAYRKIAADSAAPREIRAEALLHLAGCYEKKGDQALSVYQQIVRDFADQAAAKQAGAKLAAARRAEDSPGPMSQRRMELAGQSFDFANTDGRSFLYRDRGTQAFMIGNLTTGQSRLVFKPPVGFIDRGRDFPSKDMSMLFTIFAVPGGKEINAVMRMDGTGYREISGSFYGRPEWSWDNRYISQCEVQPDGTRRRVRISAGDGAVLPLPGPPRCLQMFSPDGRYIASTESNTSKSGIYVGPTGGTEEKLAFPGADLANATPMGWTRDGRYLLVVIDRSGTEGLYLVPMKDGKATGDPALIRYGSFLIGQTYANGALVYESVPAAGQWAAWLGTLDLEGRIMHWKALPMNRGKNPTAPAWSPEGNRIAYVTSNAAAGQNSQTVHVHDLSNGEDRELYHAGPGQMNCVWAAQHSNLFCGLATPHNTTDLFSISIESGNAQQIGSVPGRDHLLDVTPDDGGIYMTASEGDLNRWDIATQKLVSLLGPNRESRGIVGWVHMSPDKRWVARMEKGRIEVREVAGGDWKPIASSGDTQIVFSKDGNSLLYHGLDGAGKHALMRVPVIGGQPERLGDFPASSTAGLMWLSSDGRQIIADSLNPLDTWVLENFEPKR